jgi:hypothetical protein
MFQSVAVVRSLIPETMIGSLRKAGWGNLQDKVSSPRQTVRLDRIGDHDAGLLVSVRRAAPVAAHAWFEESPPNPERNSHHERPHTRRTQHTRRPGTDRPRNYACAGHHDAICTISASVKSRGSVGGGRRLELPSQDAHGAVT